MLINCNITILGKWIDGKKKLIKEDLETLTALSISNTYNDVFNGWNSQKNFLMCVDASQY